MSAPPIRRSSRNLSEEEYDALVSLCQSRLRSIFTPIMPVNVFHGSHHAYNRPHPLELLCGWEHTVNDTLHGAAKGKSLESLMNRAGCEVTSRADIQMLQKVARLDFGDVGSMRAKNHPIPTMSLHIQCDEVPRVPALARPYVSQLPQFVRNFSADEQDFWQVDLRIMLPTAIPFRLAIGSYGCLRSILDYALRWHNRSLRLLHDRLIMAHRPYPSRRREIELTLTTDIGQLFSWLGLNQHKFEQGFESESGLFQWLSEAEDGKPLAKQWSRVAGYQTWKNENPSQGSEMERRIKERKVASRPQRDPTAYTTTEQLHRFMQLLAAHYTPHTPYIPTDDTILARRQEDKVLEASKPLDAESPILPDPFAWEIIDHFGKEHEWEELMLRAKDQARGDEAIRRATAAKAERRARHQAATEARRLAKDARDNARKTA